MFCRTVRLQGMCRRRVSTGRGAGLLSCPRAHCGRLLDTKSLRTPPKKLLLTQHELTISQMENSKYRICDVMRSSLACAAQSVKFVMLYLVHLSCLLVTSSRGADTHSTSVALEGLKLEVTLEVDPHAGATRAKCVLINTTSHSVEFEIRGPNIGFNFKLLDSRGNEIAKNAVWQRRNEPGEMSKHAGGVLDPGRALSYVLSLEEAFTNPWEAGNRLVVGWDPGEDGRGDSRWIDKSLAAVVELKTNQDGSAVTSAESHPLSATAPSPFQKPPDLTPVSEEAISSSQTPSPIKESPSSTPWSIIGVAIAAVFGLLWLVLKRRS